MSRKNGRDKFELRPIEIIRDYQKFAEGSVLIKWGDTWVICSASVNEGVPPFLEGKGQGWVTAEYSMLPRATNTRSSRKRVSSSGRTAEIQRLIGRCLRGVINFNLIPDHTIYIDCDVVQADGGTRTASITGAFVALQLACNTMLESGMIDKNPVTDSVAAVSLGIVNGEVLVDLDYHEDSNADVDMNIVMAGNREIVEIQGTAEGRTFSRGQLDVMLDAAENSTKKLFGFQRKALGQ